MSSSKTKNKFQAERESEDSGYDTDELIASARKSGALKKPQAQSSKTTKRKAPLADKTVELDFSFFDPRESDFFSVRTFLRTLIQTGEDNPFDVDGMSDAISKQVEVGTTIKSNDQDEQPVGFVSVLSVPYYADTKWMKQIKDYVLNKCPNEHKKTFTKLFSTQSKLGLYLNERLMNVPGELMPELHSAVLEDLKWAQENAADKGFRNALQFDHFLMISKCFYTRDAAENIFTDDDKPAKKAKSSKLQATSDDSDSESEGKDTAHESSADDSTTYFHFEEEFFEQFAIAQFRFPFQIEKPQNETDRLPKVAVIMAFKAESLPLIIAAIRAVVPPIKQ